MVEPRIIGDWMQVLNSGRFLFYSFISPTIQYNIYTVQAAFLLSFLKESDPLLFSASVKKRKRKSIYKYIKSFNHICSFVIVSKAHHKMFPSLTCTRR